MKQIKIVGIGGSLAATSNSLAALKIALAGAAESGAKTEVLDVGALDLPIYSPDENAVTDAVRKFCETVAEAEGMIWSSPLYHGTISGSLKNALDWLELLSPNKPPYLTDKVVGLICSAGGAQGLQAINTMEYVVRALRGWTVPLVIPISQAWQAFDRDGEARDEKIKEQLRTLGRETARVAALFAGQSLTSIEAQRAESELQPIDESEFTAPA